MSGTVAVPVRPGPTALQSPKGTSSLNPDSGSSRGGQTSGSFIILPPGAQSPNPPPQVPFPPAGVSNRPPQRRLSRPLSQKPLPSLPISSSEPSKADAKPAASPVPPSSWAVHFRGFVKAVKWSKSNPQLNKPAQNEDKSCETPEDTGLLSTASAQNSQQAADPSSQAPFMSPASFFSLGGKNKLPNNVSASVGGVFLVPHAPVNAQHNFRPPTPGWMYPVPVDPYEMSTVRTVVGHSGESLRQSQDGAFPASVSPPRADFPLRKSASEIGHGSVLYAPISPAASSSSFEQLPHFPTKSTDPSREFFPRIPAFLEKDISESPPVPPKSRFSLKRALSFKRGTERKSTSDIAPTMDTVPLPTHRPSNSVDTGRRVPGFATIAVDDAGGRRLRRRSTYADNSRSDSPARRSRDPPKFMLSPDTSESSILSVTPSVTQSLSRVTGTRSAAPSGRRRLTKRKPSAKSKSLLPTTIEVETPALELADPIASVPLPPPPFPSYSEHMPMLHTPETPGLPLSAPPTTGLRTQGTHSIVASADLKPRASSPSSIPLPSVRPLPLPPVQQLPTPSTSSSSYEVWIPSHIIPTTKVAGAPPSPMRAIRPAMPHRPSLERRASRRRWTLDLASEDIDENLLKEELDRLRLLGEPNNNSGPSNMDPGWTLTRKVLLSSREVILTERTYLNQITRFMVHAVDDVGTPPLLVKHLPLLISASQAFCNRLVEDPSAWGVSAAFVTVEAILEQVFVDYCQVVGQIMLACQQQPTGQKSPAHSRFPSMAKSRTSIANGANEFGKIFIPSSKSAEKVALDDREKHSLVSTWNRADDSPRGTASRGVPRTRSMPGKSSKGRRISLPAMANSSTASVPSIPIPNHAGSNSSTHLPMTPGPSPTDKRAGGNLATGRARAITAADIAIAPPQRVTRYVMLYRDLLNGTPLTAPSRPLVQRALDGALRIAENCNRAQIFMNRKS